MEFANTLTRLIDKNNLSYKEIGEAIGTSPNAVSLWARGLRTPNVVAAYKLALYFGVTLESMLTGVSR